VLPRAPARRGSPVVRVGQNDGLTLLGEHERELDDRGLRPRDDCHLGAGVERDAVVGAVPLGESLAQLGQSAKRRVPVHVRPLSRSGQRLDDMWRRPSLRVPSSKIDERLALDRGLSCDANQQRPKYSSGSLSIRAGRVCIPADRTYCPPGSFST
jgi:hypothetical protein